MKKVIALLSMVMFSASAFALQAIEPADEACADQKASFEQYAAEQKTAFIEQTILINMADPMENMTDEQAQPLAACYASFEVKGLNFVKFVRDNAGIFPGDISGKEKAKLLTFADRVERLSEKAVFDRTVAGNNDYFIMLYVMDKIINPLQQMSEQEAAAKVDIYKTFQVKGQPLSEFIREQAKFFDMNAEIHLENFADKIDPNM